MMAVNSEALGKLYSVLGKRNATILDGRGNKYVYCERTHSGNGQFRFRGRGEKEDKQFYESASRVESFRDNRPLLGTQD